MARNIEIKAHIFDIRGCGEIAAAIAGEGPLEELVQTDTYFNVPVGRLKLREFADESNPSQLIFYARSDQVEPRPSDYHILEVTEPAALKDVLALALGVKAVVKKERAVYLYRNVRIHLDEVAGLGTFIELEAVLDEDHLEEDAALSLMVLMREFSIAEEDLLGGSYCELIGDSP
jgi:predicted adenylyl cyclase CyaB